MEPRRSTRKRKGEEETVVPKAQEKQKRMNNKEKEILHEDVPQTTTVQVEKVQDSQEKPQEKYNLLNLKYPN